ncbi:MAG: CRISPR-associated protein Cas5 [Nitrospirae bacterium]|nr:CRISPR-associated protein Cas5 [Nitrospirota bacterium]
MVKSYEVSFEIAGPAAMFTRPDSGAAQVSYPAPTFSAAKGMFEAIACLRGDKGSDRKGAATIRPTKVEICAPLKFHKYTTNYGGPLRKSNQMAQGSSYQIPATILIDVCYRLYGIVEEVSMSRDGTNHRHYLQDLFHRRLKQGKVYYTPCLGWKEFVPSYVGAFREATKKQEDIDMVIPSMLHSVFDKISDGEVAPRFTVDAVIREGELIYAK